MGVAGEAGAGAGAIREGTHRVRKGVGVWLGARTGMGQRQVPAAGEIGGDDRSYVSSLLDTLSRTA